MAEIILTDPEKWQELCMTVSLREFVATKPSSVYQYLRNLRKGVNLKRKIPTVRNIIEVADYLGYEVVLREKK